jgi:hypothetical protein
VNSETMFTPVPDGEALREVEAAFLRGDCGLVGAHPVATIPPLGTDRPAGVDDQPVMPTVRTSNRRCC